MKVQNDLSFKERDLQKMMCQLILGFFLLAAFTKGSETKHILEANETYIGLPGEKLVLKWIYTGNKAYDDVSIYMPDPSAPTQRGSYAGVKLWQLKYHARNKTFVRYKLNVVNSVFNNLTAFEVYKNSVFYLKIKAIPRNISAFQFTCRLAERDLWAGIKERKISVRVAAPPVITITVDKGNAIHVPKGREVNIKCTATGFPVPKIEMRKDSLKLATSKSSINQVTLKLPNFQPVNAGRYVCNARNIAGFATQDSVITITYIELREASSLQIRSSLGSSEQLYCPIEGYPPVIYSWFNLNKQLSSYRESTIMLDKYDKFGNYSCVGQNDAGFKKVTFSIMMDSATMGKRSSSNGISLTPAMTSVAASIIMFFWCCN